jgi:translation initiation factor 3 subunit G
MRVHRSSALRVFPCVRVDCGETGHWTLKCPKRQSIDAFAGKGGPSSSSAPSGGDRDDNGQGGSKYVPMHMRSGAGAKPVATLGRDDSNTLRVTNISEDVTEDDLRELISRFGHTQRIYLARDRQTQESRGFAFVSFAMRQDAERCMEKLNGHGYANLILHVEFAKPREEREQPRE